jgi:hypothetical protein
MHAPGDLVLAEKPDGSKVIRGFATALYAQRPDGFVVNDPETGVPKPFGSISQAAAWAGAGASPELRAAARVSSD